jgi:hypothetical protein
MSLQAGNARCDSGRAEAHSELCGYEEPIPGTRGRVPRRTFFILHPSAFILLFSSLILSVHDFSSHHSHQHLGLKNLLRLAGEQVS